MVYESSAMFVVLGIQACFCIQPLLIIKVPTDNESANVITKNDYTHPHQVLPTLFILWVLMRALILSMLTISLVLVHYTLLGVISTISLLCRLYTIILANAGYSPIHMEILLLILGFLLFKLSGHFCAIIIFQNDFALHIQLDKDGANLENKILVQATQNGQVQLKGF